MIQKPGELLGDILGWFKEVVLNLEDHTIDVQLAHLYSSTSDRNFVDSLSFTNVKGRGASCREGVPLSRGQVEHLMARFP